nr:10467_t:CDS:2 [Entrophospora candida]
MKNENGYHEVARPEITVAERNCIDAGWSFHMSCDSFTTDNLEVIFGLRLLYETLKYIISEKKLDVQQGIEDFYESKELADSKEMQSTWHW